MDTQAKADEDRRFAEWLATRGRIALTAVKGDPSWNHAVLNTTAHTVTTAIRNAGCTAAQTADGGLVVMGPHGVTQVR